MENWRKITMVVWVAAGLMAGCHPGMDSLEESVAAPIAQEEEAASDEEGSSFEDETDFSEGSSDEWESDEDPTMDSEETDSGDDGEVNDEESEGEFGGDDTWWDEDESSEEGDVNEDETIAGERFNVVLGKAANLEGEFFTNGWSTATVPEYPNGIASDGDFFDASHEWDVDTVWWSGLEPALVIQLDGVYAIESILIQADDNDGYLLSYHAPGTPDDEWIVVYEAPAVGGWGMQMRAEYCLAEMVQADALRFEAHYGDNWYSVGEIQAFGYELESWTPAPSEPVEDEEDEEDEQVTPVGELTNVILGVEADLEGVFFTNGWASATIPGDETNVASDGAFFDVSHEWDQDTIWWSGAAPYLVFELDGSYAIESVVVQADDNDSYLLSYHVPGTPDDEWVPLYEAPVVGGWGMQTRDENYLAELVEADAFRFEAISGDNLYSVGEIQAWGYPVMSCNDVFNVAAGNQVDLTDGDFFNSGWGSAVLPSDMNDVITNDAFFPEGHEWDVETIWWAGLDSAMVIDLNGEFTLTELVVQADNNDTYLVSYHAPGTPEDEWIPLYEVPAVGGWGMQTREPHLVAENVADSLRIEAVSGDGWYSVGEVQAFGTVNCD